MKLIFDFDYTLFKAGNFRQSLSDVFERFGVDKELFFETYEQIERQGWTYQFCRQLKLIRRVNPAVDAQALSREAEKTIDKAERFLYPDVLPALERLKKRFSLILLSYGEDKLQREKVKKSKISCYFRKVFITQDINKISELEKFLAPKEMAILVDDNSQFLLKAKEVFPCLITVRINRGEGRYSCEPDNRKINYSVRKLKELERVLYEDYKN
jgi:FMN phosphatase YigB (HAD superfamily)